MGKHYHAKNDQFVAQAGFTDLYILTSADFTQSANNTAQTINLQSADLAKGDIILADVLLEVKTPTTGMTTCTCSVGVTGAVTQFIAAQDTIAGNLYFANANSVGHYSTVATGKRMVATFTPGASEALTAATAGEYWVWARISRQALRNVQA